MPRRLRAIGLTSAAPQGLHRLDHFARPRIGLLSTTIMAHLLAHPDRRHLVTPHEVEPRASGEVEEDRGFGLGDPIKHDARQGLSGDHRKEGSLLIDGAGMVRLGLHVQAARSPSSQPRSSVSASRSRTSGSPG